MAFSPKELAETLSEKDSVSANNLEKTLDEKLVKYFVNEKKTVVWVNFSINKRVQQEVRKRYQKTGWSDVTFKQSSDPREQGGTEVTFIMH
jgi:hypothetical protein